MNGTVEVYCAGFYVIKWDFDQETEMLAADDGDVDQIVLDAECGGDFMKSKTIASYIRQNAQYCEPIMNHDNSSK